MGKITFKQSYEEDTFDQPEKKHTKRYHVFVTLLAIVLILVVVAALLALSYDKLGFGKEKDSNSTNNLTNQSTIVNGSNFGEVLNYTSNNIEVI